MAHTVIVRFIVKGVDAFLPNPAIPLEDVKCTIKAKQITNVYTDTKNTNSFGVADFDYVRYNSVGYTCTFSLEGYTQSYFEFAAAPLNSFNITLYKANSVILRVKVKNLITGANVKQAQITASSGSDPLITDATDSQGGDSMLLRQNKNYTIKIVKAGFSSVAGTVSTTNVSPITKNFLMSPLN